MRLSNLKILQSFFPLLVLLTGDAVAQPSGSWQRVAFPDSVRIDRLEFVDSTIGFALGAQSVAHGLSWIRLFKTIDGGHTWQKLSLANTMHNGDSLRDLGKHHLSITGDGCLFLTDLGKIDVMRSTDLGASWVAEAPGLPYTAYHAFFSCTDGVRAGKPFAFTHDGGANYDSTLDPGVEFDTTYKPSSNLSPDWFNDSTWLFSSDRDSGIVLLFTSNRGANWEVIRSAPRGEHPPYFTVQPVCVRNTSSVWAEPSDRRVSYSLLRSNDYGHTWEVVDTTLATRHSRFIPSNSDTIGFITFSDSMPHNGSVPNAFCLSTNRGASWQMDSSSFGSVSLVDGQLLDPDHRWLVGDSVLDPNGNTTFNSFLFIWSPGRSAVKQVAAAQAFTIYPTPAHAGAAIAIDGLKKVTAARLINDLGVAWQLAAPSEKPSHLRLLLPRVSSGEYQLSLSLPDGSVVTHSLILLR